MTYYRCNFLFHNKNLMLEVNLRRQPNDIAKLSCPTFRSKTCQRLMSEIEDLRTESLPWNEFVMIFLTWPSMFFTFIKSRGSERVNRHTLRIGSREPFWPKFLTVSGVRYAVDLLLNNCKVSIHSTVKHSVHYTVDKAATWIRTEYIYYRFATIASTYTIVSPEGLVDLNFCTIWIKLQII